MTFIITLFPVTLRICSRNCFLSIVTGLDLSLTRIIMLSKLELKIRKSFLYLRCLDLEHHSLSIKNQFKSKLKNKLLEILKNEDDYIIISDIRVQFSKSTLYVTPSIEYSPPPGLTLHINTRRTRLLLGLFNIISLI